jgi:hypothetical protein
MARTRTLARIGLRRHDFDPSILGRFLIAGETDDVDPVIRKNESAGARVAAIVDLDRDRPLSGRQDRRHEPARPGLDELVMPDRLAAKESYPCHRAFYVPERVRLPRLGDHEFGEVCFWPRMPSRGALVDDRTHRQILTSDEHLLDIDLWRGFCRRARRRIASASQDHIRGAER